LQKVSEGLFVLYNSSRDVLGAAAIEKFKGEIKAALRLPVHYEAEFWTSAQAKRWQGKTEKLDASAAAIIFKRSE